MPDADPGPGEVGGNIDSPPYTKACTAKQADSTTIALTLWATGPPRVGQTVQDTHPLFH